MYATVRSQYSSKVVSGTIWWSVKNENNCYFSVIIWAERCYSFFISVKSCWGEWKQTRRTQSECGHWLLSWRSAEITVPYCDPNLYNDIKAAKIHCNYSGTAFTRVARSNEAGTTRTLLCEIWFNKSSSKRCLLNLWVSLHWFSSSVTCYLWESQRACADVVMFYSYVLDHLLIMHK